MANKAVFLDRDRTLMEDPGYLADAEAVKLLPGVELAIKSLSQAGYKIVVVTNQSGIARGLLTEENLKAIHAELRRQLAESGAHLDAIYFCPYHPEGTVEPYAVESDLRKPKPGMLLKAAEDMEIDLADSWMVGDGARDVEAGQRAGCRTVRVRGPRPQTPAAGQAQDEKEDARPDFTVRNLTDAARVILRESGRRQAPAGRAPAKAAARPDEQGETMEDSKVRQEILRYVRQMVVDRHVDEFSYTKLLGAVAQMLALATLLMTFVRMLQNEVQAAMLWALISVVLQVMALTFFMIHRPR